MVGINLSPYNGVKMKIQVAMSCCLNRFCHTLHQFPNAKQYFE